MAIRRWRMFPWPGASRRKKEIICGSPGRHRGSDIIQNERNKALFEL